MDVLIICLPCFDPCVLFSCLVSALFRVELMCATERGCRPNRSQVVSTLLPSISVLKPLFCEGALRHRNTMELNSNYLKAVRPKRRLNCTSVEDETEQKTRKENRTKRFKTR